MRRCFAAFQYVNLTLRVRQNIVNFTLCVRQTTVNIAFRVRQNITRSVMSTVSGLR